MNRYFKEAWQDARDGKKRLHHMADGLTVSEQNKIRAYNNGYDAYLIDKKKKTNK
jgi:hypothetical protein